MSASAITARFLQCIDQLVTEKKIRSRRYFALSVGYHAQGISEMVAGRRDAPIELLEKSIQMYRIHPTYLFLGHGPRFFSDGEQDGLQVKTLQILTNELGKERIIHVPVPAQAGYSASHHDPQFISDLPSYMLPDAQFQHGSYRSFEIEGLSMEPTFKPGDIVIASFVEPRYWDQAIKSGQIMVLVTQDSVVIKRVVNKWKAEQKLECHSDNPEFQPYEVNATELREAWRVRMKLTPHFDAPFTPMASLDIHQQLQTQMRMLENLQAQLQAGK